MSTSTGSATPGVTGATEALDGFLAPLGAGSPRPPLRYLRRKPGRGLVAVFGPGGSGEVFTVTVDERAFRDGGVPGVHRFPEDPGLPHLPAVMTPAAHPSLAGVLESTARRVHGVPSERPLRAIAAEAVRYKPGDRCVLRYRLAFGGPEGGATTGTLVAKLYREPGEAQRADDLLARLRTGTAAGWTARPLGVAPGLPLALTEDLGSAGDPVPARSGLREVRIGSPSAFPVVAAAGRALAELHTGGLDPSGLDRRTGTGEAGKAAKRAAVLERHVPALGAEVQRVAGMLCDRLGALPEDTVRTGHGSYKPSQLLVRGGAVFVVDFDQVCLADPALDVGYFLAYLRPAGLWYGRAGRRAWFEAAGEVFAGAYVARLVERGESPATAAGIAGRAHVHEAALLLKIAARRANRLHSPRPGEVAAVLDEVTRCLRPVPLPRGSDG